MSFFEWTAAYSVGDAQFDDQHRTLIHLMNGFYGHHLEGQPDLARACLARFLAKTADHFRDEEEMMERTGYPRLAEHRRRHQELLGTVSKLVREYRPSHGREDAGRLASFFKVWLSRHILGEDKVYAPYAKKAPAAPTAS